MKKVLFAILITMLFSSCAYKSIPYLKEVQNDTIMNQKLHETTICSSDELTIVITTTTQEAAQAFNLFSIPTPITGNNSTRNSTSYSNLQTYLVDKDGNIDFPILGKIYVNGLTKSELAELIKSKIYPQYIREEPIVTIRHVNFKVSILGEVSKPGHFTINNERVSIFDAIAMAGDLTIYGNRKNVLIVREEDNGKKTSARLNLQDKNILNSPYFYLKQNDIIYVEPNKPKGNSAVITNVATFTVSIGTMIALYIRLFDK